MRDWDRFIVAVFLVAICLPGLALIGGIDGAGDSENRTPAPPPAAPTSWDTARAWPDAFTRYFEDHFAFRRDLVRAQAALRLEGLGVSPAASVIPGEDGWYYYADDSALEDYTVAWALSDSDLEIWATTLQQTQDWLAGQGIAYAFVLAPDKHAIYPEPMPDAIRRLRERTWTDQLADHLAAHTSVNVVDLRPVLRRLRERERVYHKTDTHWNDRGAHAAYVEVLDSLGGAHGIRPLPRSSFRDVERTVPGLDLAAMLGLSGDLVERDLALEPSHPRRARMTEPATPATHNMYPRMATGVDDPSLPRAVIFRDSFTSGLVPFLSEHFSRALYLWEYDVNPAIIAAERPQVVIQQIVGRHLGTTLPYNYLASRDSDVEGRARSGGGEETRTPAPAPPE
ncbi:MAG: hypothetical protein AB7P99_03175 [Vicinamibacterales bacterium]